MSKNTVAAIFLSLSILTPSAFSSTSEDIDKILEFYRTEDYLQQALPCVLRQLESQSAEHKFSDAQKKKIDGLIKRIYTGPNLYKIFRETFPENFSAEKVEWKTVFLKSGGGVKLRQAYASALRSSPTVRQSYYDNNSVKLLTVNQKNALMSFITVTKQDLSYATMESKCDLTIRLVNNTYLDPKQKITIRHLKKAADKKIPDYLEPGRKYYEVFDFFLLREYRIKEINELIGFYSSKQGQVFLEAYRNTLITTLEAAAGTLQSQVQKRKK